MMMRGRKRLRMGEEQDKRKCGSEEDTGRRRGEKKYGERE